MDRYEASWQLVISFVHGLVLGNLVFLPLMALLALGANADASTPAFATLPAALTIWVVGLPIMLLLSIVGGAVLGFPLLVLAWLVLMVFLDRIDARPKPWCIAAPAAAAALWFLGEWINLASASLTLGWREIVTGVGPRLLLALLCASFASKRYFSALAAARSWQGLP